MQKHTLELEKIVQKRSDPKKLLAQITKIAERGEDGGRKNRGWTVEITGDNFQNPMMISGNVIYRCKLTCDYNPKRPRDPSVVKIDFDNMVKVINTAGNSPGWKVSHVDGRLAEIKEGGQTLGYTPVSIPSNWKDSVSHIYDRDSQIEIILSAIQAGIVSDFQDRFHCALIGDPACGKTETLRSLKNMLGEEAILEYDATATTQAGAIKDLDSRDELPRIMIVEEIEKTDEDSLRWLLSVMDHRAEIRKVNYRENIQKETRLLTLATVNDYKLFRKIMYGALASRFAYHLKFPRPDENLLRKILLREITRVGGNKKWIEPALKFAVQNNLYDPRKVTAICLCGRDDLFDGSFQAKLLACSTEDD